MVPWFSAVGLAVSLATIAPLHAQDFTLLPTFGVLGVQSGFLPDRN